MPDLSCAVTSCFYNKTDRCCKENIQVEGADARVMNETSCGSFRPRRGDSFVNMEAGTPEAKTSVHCEAQECVHNDNCNCVADRIGIAGAHACDCKETECSTFSCGCR